MAILTLPYDRQTEYALFTVKETMLNLPGCASGRSGCASVKKVNLKESLVTDKLTESLTSECV